MQRTLSRRAANELIAGLAAAAVLPALSSGAEAPPAGDPQISAADPHPRKRIPVLDTEMSYVEVGSGDPIVLLHGNPNSSYIWRNIIPHLSGLGRCLAPDLIGMGQSGKSPTFSYRFVDHARYLDAWFDALQLNSRITLVLHDWGTALGFYRASRYPTQIRAIAYMEAGVLPRHWTDLGKGAEFMRTLRTDKGERMVLEQNLFVESMASGVIRKLSDAEMAAYRAPFPDPVSRLPTLIWPREIPIDGSPADVTAIVESNGKWASQSDTPKLLIVGNPGSSISGRVLDYCRTWRQQREVTVKGIHFLQEDSPHEIGTAVAEFVKTTRV